MGSRVKVPVSFCYLVPSIILEGLVWRTNPQLSQSISLQYINLYISFICFNSWHSSVLPHFSLTNKQYVTCNPAGNYMFKAINRNTGTRYEICWELTIKTPERRQWHRSGVFIVNSELISHFFLVFIFLTLNKYLPAGKCSLSKKNVRESQPACEDCSLHLEEMKAIKVGILMIFLT